METTNLLMKSPAISPNPDLGNSFRSARGFTLLEIVISVLILSVALVTLLGLQASVVRRTLTDRHKKDAMLMARQILAAIETSEEPVEPQKINDTAEKVLGRFIPIDRQSDKEVTDLDSKSVLMAELIVDIWGIPNISDTAMKRILLSVYPSDFPEDSFEVAFFIPNEESPSAPQ